MSKDAYYFSHDAGARNDPKISAMRMEYKSEGYGWFWIIIEVLREQEDYRLPCKEYIWNALAMQMQCKKEDCIAYINACIERYELFESDGDCFWSNSLIKRMESRNALSEKRRESANKRWENANAMQVDANAMQTDARKGKEKKVNEIKGKEINKEPPISPLQGDASDLKKNKRGDEKVHRLEIGPTFEDFWEAYDKKRGSKEKVRKQWNAMSLKDKQTAMIMIPAYKAHEPNVKFRKDPERYISYRVWEFECLKEPQLQFSNNQNNNRNGQKPSNEGLLAEFKKRVVEQAANPNQSGYGQYSQYATGR